MSDMHLMLVDGVVQQVDLGPMLARHRAEVIRHRADAIDQAASLLLDEAFDPGDTWDAAEAAGIPEGMIDSAGNVALELAWVEHLRRD